MWETGRLHASASLSLALQSCWRGINGGFKNQLEFLNDFDFFELVFMGQNEGAGGGGAQINIHLVQSLKAFDVAEFPLYKSPLEASFKLSMADR